ncbi:hypothetical protein [Jeotgalibacillus marinus]|uniref:Uncharacterized protein n=1 Tax=Jeotgalibacillus marinus TaxID=86667 RepID=A0ABV3Q4S2_9BACL
MDSLIVLNNLPDPNTAYVRQVLKNSGSTSVLTIDTSRESYIYMAASTGEDCEV